MSTEVPHDPRKSGPLSDHTVVFLRTSSPARVAVYNHLKSQGLSLIMVHPVLNPDFAHSFTKWVLCDTNDVEALAATLERELKGIRIDAFVSLDEYGVYPAACLQERYHHRPIPLSAKGLQMTSIKSKFREFCGLHNINSPRNVALYSPSENPVERMKQNGVELPVILKPACGAGSMLARRCDTLQEVEEFATFMWANLRSHKDAKHLENLGAALHIVVEEYIGGQEVDIDCTIDNGRVAFAVISDNFEPTPPFFLEVGGLCPTALPIDAQGKLLALLESFVVAHGNALHGVLHFEAKYDFAHQRAYVIEVNCRLGSAETNTMLNASHQNVQLGESIVRCALGMPLTNLDVALHKPNSCWCASVNLYAPKSGVVKEISAPDGDPALVYAQVAASVGAQVIGPPQSTAHLVWMVAKGATKDEAIANINRLTAAVSMVIE